MSERVAASVDVTDASKSCRIRILINDTLIATERLPSVDNFATSKP